MLRVARMHVRDRQVAEEVVQETWLAVLDGIDRFEGRSSLKTWLFTILTNRAKTRAARERRTVPVSALVASEAGGTSPPSIRSASSTPRPSASPRRGRRRRRRGARCPRTDCSRRRRSRAWPTRIEGAARGAARGHPPARRRGLQRRRGGRRARDQRRQPARPAAPRPLEGARGAGGLPGGRIVIGRADLSCRELVELVTDYLEGALDRRTRRASSATSRAATTAPSTSSRFARRSA